MTLSGDIKALVDNPESFLRDNRLGFNLNRNIARKDQLVKLVRVTANSYDLKFSETESEENTISSYILGYKTNEANDAVFLDIPSRGVKEGTFLFTSELSGCSLVVTRLKDDTFRVFHDFRVNSAVLYDNVVMSVDWDDYNIPGQFADYARFDPSKGRAVGHALACMQFTDGKWKLFIQRQYPKFPYPRGQVEVSLEIKDRDETSIEVSFGSRRARMQQRIKALANKLKIDSAIIHGAEDGTYEGSGEFNENDPSIHGWNELRNAIKEGLRNWKQEVKNDTKYPIDPLAIDAVCEKHMDMLDAAEKLDRIWLWLQIKKATGSSGNQSEGGDQEPPNDTISERYAEMERELSSRSDNVDFNKGYENYGSIDIPGFKPTMTSSEMKQLFVATDKLSQEQQGALCRSISIASDQESLLKLQEDIQNDFKLEAKGFLEAAPQHFFLSNVGDKYGGRCYPLVRAMAVALCTGEYVAKSFLDKLKEFSESELTPLQQKNAECLRDALAGLHANAEAYSASTALHNRYSITDVVEKLRISERNKVYALNTEAHSMLVGVTVVDNQRKYYFYDPNFLMASFDQKSNFYRAMNHFFVKRGFAKHYAAIFNKAEEPEFNLVLIDPDKMGEARVAEGVTVRQMCTETDIGNIIGSKKRNNVVEDVESQFAEDLNLRAAITAAEAYEWTARWRDASIRLAQEEEIPGNWAPLLDTLHESTDGSYRMQYINSNNTEETRWVSTKDKTFKEFVSYLSTKWKALRKDFTFENGKFTAHAELEGDPIDGLNAMAVVQTIIDWLDRGGIAQSGESINAELSLAMKVHSYVNMVQIAHTSILDINKVAGLVKTALKGEQLAGDVSLSTFSKVFKTTATEGVGVLLGFVIVGLDAYELSLAPNDAEKAIFGTQLAFDLASSVAGVAGLGAGLAGAAGVAMGLSGAGVILGGLGIGIGALAQNFGKIASDAQQVGNYFADVDEAYSSGGYKYENNEKATALVPLPEAVVTSIKMADKEIEVGFDSQLIYRTHHGPTGSGRINYFFWAGDFPRMVKDRSQAINVREGIGYKKKSSLIKLDGHADCLTLPVTPKSFISYDYQTLPFTTSRHDRGFDVIRRLEEDERFDYDFYIFPSEYTINKIMFEYVETKIAVVLDKRSIRLQMYPELPKQLHRYLSYEVEGSGGEYCIGLAKGYSLSLNTSGSHSTETTWIIDGSTLGEDSIEVGKDWVKVGGITIDLLSRKMKSFLVISPGGEVSLVDFASQQALIQSEDASKWTNKNETIQQHLQRMAQEHRISAHFVLVNNYTVEVKGHEREVGRAYYDVAGNRMLYIDVEQDIGREIIKVPLSSDGHWGGDQPTGQVYTAANARDDAVLITRDAVLGAVVGDDAYFFHTQKKRLWRVNGETHRITAKYYTSTEVEDSEIEISSVSQYGTFVLLAITPINQAGKLGVEQIMYQIHKDNMVLSTVIGNSDMFRRIYTKEKLSLYDLVGGRERQSAMFTKFADQTLLLPSNAPIVSALCKDESGVQFCCWLRTSDNSLIRSNLKRPVPNDLILTVSSHKVNGQEVFYFYSRKEESVYVQQGPGYANDSQPKQIKVAGLSNLFNVHGEVFATTKAGLILRVLLNGSVYLEAVNEHWLGAHPKWWLDLANLDGKKATFISVMGVQDNNNKVVPIWYQDGMVVIGSSKLHGKQLQFFGVVGNDALIFDIENGLLYRQPLMGSGALVALVDTEGKLVSEGDNKIPEAETMLYGEKVKQTAMVDGNLYVTTESGVVLLVGGYHGMATLVAVDKAWQASTHDFKVDMENLAKKWSHTDVVVLQGDSVHSVPEWYHISSGETVIAKDLKWSDHPIWIGMSINDVGTFYIYAQDALYTVHKESGAMTEIGRFTAIKVQGNSLVLQSTSLNAEINIPTVFGLDFCVVTATNANVVIDAENLKHYKVITINNKWEGNGNQMVKIKCGDEHLLVHKMGNDMVMVDVSTGSSVNLTNVLVEEPAVGRYTVKFGLDIDEEFQISDVCDCLEKSHPLLVDGIFSVTQIIELTKANKMAKNNVKHIKTH
ncbi:hypothetical protein KI387_028457 [Taxus chinensis]|uniref:TcdA/TcdB toxin pore forming domain-containing protein n=1 Tax=Taxus chinensis TaxID=29808 RepID=A0AA38CAG2_TAXCH|nr:hypothetical protein KI387_028457 [Taxus chinensis]